jgi:hypothetical protein
MWFALVSPSSPTKHACKVIIKQCYSSDSFSNFNVNSAWYIKTFFWFSSDTFPVIQQNNIMYSVIAEISNSNSASLTTMFSKWHTFINSDICYLVSNTKKGDTKSIALQYTCVIYQMTNSTACSRRSAVTPHPAPEISWIKKNSMLKQREIQ